MRKNIFSSLLCLVIFTLLVIRSSSNCLAQKPSVIKTVDSLNKSDNPISNINDRKSVNPTISSELSGELQSMPKIVSQDPEKAECEGSLPTITFPGAKSVNPTQPKSVNPTQPRSNATNLQPDAIDILKSVAAQLKVKPDCKLKVSGHGTANKMEQQLSWERVNTIIRFLVEKTGISSKRFIFEYGNEGDPNTVDLMFTSEDGPTSVPQPHPQFRTLGN